MTGVVGVNPVYTFRSALAGGPLANGTVDVFVAGTTTRTNTWQDEALTSLNANPIVLDSAGRATIWFDPSITYKFVVKNAGGATQYTSDNIKGAEPSNVLRAELAAPGGDALVWGTRPGIYRIGLAASLAADCGPSVQAAVNSFNGKAGTVIFDPAYTYTQRTTVFIPYNVSIDFNSAQIIPAGGALTNDYLYFTNMNSAQVQTTPLDTALISEHPFIYGFRADATDSGYATARGFLTKSRHQFEHFWCRDMSQAVKKIGNSNDQYMDRLRYRDFEVQSPQGTDWMLDVTYYGDALDIDGYHHAATSGQNQNGIHTKNCNGGGIRKLINGSVWVEQCSAFSMDHVHNEYGSIRISSSGATLRDIFQWYRPDLGQTNPLTLDVSTGGGRYPFSVSLQNYRFVLQHLVSPFAANYVDADYFDILSSLSVSLHMENVKRFMFVNLDPSLGYESAPRITFDGTATVAQWDTNQSAHCKSSIVSGGGKVSTPFNSFTVPGSVLSDFGISASAHGTWTEATGTYFYAFQQLWGPKDRLVGKNSAERSVNVASASTIPRCQFDRSSSSSGALTLRIYRGTVSGSYDKVVDLPVGSAPMFYDMGHYLGTGERWRARGAGAVDTINTAYTKVDVAGTLVVVHGNSGIAAPTVGAWATGDRVVVDNAAPGERPGWDCTAAGTPGTWDALSKKAMTFSTSSFNPPSIAAGAETTTTVTATGVIASDFALASFDLNSAGGLEITATCMTDAVMVKLRNVTGAPVDLTAGTLRVRVVKF